MDVGEPTRPNLAGSKSIVWPFTGSACYPSPSDRKVGCARMAIALGPTQEYTWCLDDSWWRITSRVLVWGAETFATALTGQRSEFQNALPRIFRVLRTGFWNPRLSGLLNQ